MTWQTGISILTAVIALGLLPFAKWLHSEVAKSYAKDHELEKRVLKLEVQMEHISKKVDAMAEDIAIMKAQIFEIHGKLCGGGS